MTFGVDACQCQGNLLWRPACQQEMMDHTEQTGADMKSALRSGALPAVLAALSGLRAGVATGISVATQLPADCAGRPIQHASDGPDTVFFLLQAGDSAVRWIASADLTGWLVLHFTFESSLFDFKVKKITHIN